MYVCLFLKLIALGVCLGVPVSSCADPAELLENSTRIGSSTRPSLRTLTKNSATFPRTSAKPKRFEKSILLFLLVYRILFLICVIIFMSSGLEAVQLVSEYFNKSCVQLFVLSFQPDCKKINFLNQSNFGLYCELSRIFSTSLRTKGATSKKRLGTPE